MVELVLSVDQWDETVANEKYVEERNCCERRTHKVIGSSNKNRKNAYADVVIDLYSTWYEANVGLGQGPEKQNT